MLMSFYTYKYNPLQPFFKIPRSVKHVRLDVQSKAATTMTIALIANLAISVPSADRAVQKTAKLVQVTTTALNAKRVGLIQTDVNTGAMMYVPR